MNITSKTNLNSNFDVSDLNDKFNLAVDYHKAQQVTEALNLYSEILRADPLYLPAIHNSSILAIQKEDFSLAETIIGNVYSSIGFDENLFVNYAICKLKLNKIDESIAIIERILETNPDSAAGNGLLSRIQLNGKHYLEYLADFHKWRKPEIYVEIGIHKGESLALANPATLSIGIDPSPMITSKLNNNTSIYSLKSDVFFNNQDVNSLLGNKPIGMAFIDGMHVFEAALKDFINIERFSSRNTTVLIHDCIPLNKATSTRQRNTTFWSGDVWKIVLILKKYRPDLKLFTIPAPPTGLCVITNLNPESKELAENYKQICDEFLPLDYNYIANDKQQSLNVINANWETVKSCLEN